MSQLLGVGGPFNCTYRDFLDLGVRLFRLPQNFRQALGLLRDLLFQRSDPGALHVLLALKLLL